MSALYLIQFSGLGDFGGGAFYIGKGVVLGVDVAKVTFKGSYTESNGRLQGTVKMSVPPGVTLVTGMALPQGAAIEIAIDWPSNFSNGQPQSVTVAGRPVQAVVEKIGDLP